jgi:cytidine deaminase
VKTQELEALIREAQAVRKHAYAPYSGYTVGAAVLGGSGATYAGANVENAAYPTSMCAERAAIFNAISSGEREIRLVVVQTEDAGPPCGACRQVMAEFGLEGEVVVVDGEGAIQLRMRVQDLLPHSFGAGNLQLD